MAFAGLVTSMTGGSSGLIHVVELQEGTRVLSDGGGSKLSVSCPNTPGLPAEVLLPQ